MDVRNFILSGAPMISIHWYVIVRWGRGDCPLNVTLPCDRNFKPADVADVVFDGNTSEWSAALAATWKSRRPV
jgi:hypothetical protein